MSSALYSGALLRSSPLRFARRCGPRGLYLLARRIALVDTDVRRLACRVGAISLHATPLRSSSPCEHAAGAIHAHSLHKGAHCLPRDRFIFSRAAMLYATSADLRDRAASERENERAREQASEWLSRVVKPRLRNRVSQQST